MFNFVCKTLLLHLGRRRCTVTTTATTTNYCKNFAFPVFIKCISTTTFTSKEDSFTVSYLVNSRGFSRKSALLASKRVYFDSPERPDSVIALFKSHGFSDEQISQLIRGNPRVLCASPEKTLLPKLNFFYSKGFSSSEFAKFSSANPTLLHRSLEKHIIPSFNSLCDLFKSSETAVATIKINPYILVLDVETYVAPKINVLRDIGVPERNILLLLKIWHFPRNTDFGTFRNTVEVVKEMGFNPLKSQFVLAILAKFFCGNNWESRVNVYRSWGWSEEEFLSAFRRNPFCMMASNDKIMRVMDFLVNKMEIESSAIAKHPYVVGFSIEKRFIPRAAVIQFLLSKGLIKRNNTNLIRIFKLSEKSFLGKFVNSFDEAPELLKLYQENLGISKMRKTSVSSERDGVIAK